MKKIQNAQPKPKLFEADKTVGELVDIHKKHILGKQPTTPELTRGPAAKIVNVSLLKNVPHPIKPSKKNPKESSTEPVVSEQVVKATEPVKTVVTEPVKKTKIDTSGTVKKVVKNVGKNSQKQTKKKTSNQKAIQKKSVELGDEKRKDTKPSTDDPTKIQTQTNETTPSKNTPVTIITASPIKTIEGVVKTTDLSSTIKKTQEAKNTKKSIENKITALKSKSKLSKREQKKLSKLEYQKQIKNIQKYNSSITNKGIQQERKNFSNSYKAIEAEKKKIIPGMNELNKITTKFGINLSTEIRKRSMLKNNTIARTKTSSLLIGNETKITQRTGKIYNPNSNGFNMERLGNPTKMEESVTGKKPEEQKKKGDGTIVVKTDAKKIETEKATSIETGEGERATKIETGKKPEETKIETEKATSIETEKATSIKTGDGSTKIETGDGLPKPGPGDGSTKIETENPLEVVKLSEEVKPLLEATVKDGDQGPPGAPGDLVKKIGTETETETEEAPRPRPKPRKLSREEKKIIERKNYLEKLSKEFVPGKEKGFFGKLFAKITGALDDNEMAEIKRISETSDGKGGFGDPTNYIKSLIDKQDEKLVIATSAADKKHDKVLAKQKAKEEFKQKTNSIIAEQQATYAVNKQQQSNKIARIITRRTTSEVRGESDTLVSNLTKPNVLKKLREEAKKEIRRDEKKEKKRAKKEAEAAKKEAKEEAKEAKVIAKDEKAMRKRAEKAGMSVEKFQELLDSNPRAKKVFEVDVNLPEVEKLPEVVNLSKVGGVSEVKKVNIVNPNKIVKTPEQILANEIKKESNKANENARQRKIEQNVEQKFSEIKYNKTKSSDQIYETYYTPIYDYAIKNVYKTLKDLDKYENIRDELQKQLSSSTNNKKIDIGRKMSYIDSLIGDIRSEQVDLELLKIVENKKKESKNTNEIQYLSNMAGDIKNPNQKQRRIEQWKKELNNLAIKNIEPLSAVKKHQLLTVDQAARLRSNYIPSK